MTTWHLLKPTGKGLCFQCEKEWANPPVKVAILSGTQRRGSCGHSVTPINVTVCGAGASFEDKMAVCLQDVTCGVCALAEMADRAELKRQDLSVD